MNVIQGQKGCPRYRTLVDAYVSNELVTETSAEVARHLEECEECRVMADSAGRGRLHLRRAVSRIEAPPGLRETVLRQIDLQGNVVALPATGKPVRMKVPVWVRVAALVCLTVAAGTTYVSREREQARVGTLMEVGWRDHQNCALGGQVPSEAPSREVMMASLGAEYSPLLKAVEAHLGGFKIRTGHRCRVHGRQYAHVVLQENETLLSISIVRKQTGESFPDPNREFSGEKHGIQLTAFETPGHLGFVMSNDTERNGKFAAAITPSLRGVLGSI